MSVPLDYNDAATLGHHLSDLGDLHHLYSLRHQAWYDRKERLAEFCILGRFYLDSCGNFGLLEKAPADLYRRSHDPKHPKICPWS